MPNSLKTKLRYAIALVNGTKDAVISFGILKQLLESHIHPLMERLNIDAKELELTHVFDADSNFEGYEASLQSFKRQCIELLDKLPQVKEETQ